MVIEFPKFPTDCSAAVFCCVRVYLVYRLVLADAVTLTDCVVLPGPAHHGSAGPAVKGCLGCDFPLSHRYYDPSVRDLFRDLWFSVGQSPAVAVPCLGHIWVLPVCSRSALPARSVIACVLM